MKFAIAILLCSLATVLDIESTWLNAGHMIEIEANPIQKAIMIAYGLSMAMCLRAVFNAVTIVCLLTIRKYKPFIAYALLIVWCIQQAIVLVSITDYIFIRETLFDIGLPYEIVMFVMVCLKAIESFF